MSDDHSLLSATSSDGFVPAEDPTDNIYSVYTGLPLRRRFLPFGYRRLRRKVSCSCSKILANVPVSIVIIVIVLLVSLGKGLYAVLLVKPRPVIDYSLKAFSIPNHEVTRHAEAFDLAVRQNKETWLYGGRRSKRYAVDTENIFHQRQNFYRRNRSSTLISQESKIRRLKRYAASPTQSYPQQRIYVVYVAIGGSSSNIFTRERIETIRKVEKDVVTMPGFSDFCLKVHGRCSAVNSLVSKFFSHPLSDENFEDTVRQALSSKKGYLYTDGHVSQKYLSSTFLRSEVVFGVPLPGLLFCFRCFFYLMVILLVAI